MILHIVISAGVLLLVSVLVALFIVWFKKPSWALRAFVWLSVRRCGLRVQYVRGQKLVYCYGERGVPTEGQSTMVFVHGFSAGKDSWVGTIQNLPNDCHVIAVDLPGHGGTELPAADEAPCIQFMVDSLRELLVTAKINDRPIHLIGTSMGGTVVGWYAAQYPHEIDRLTIICPCVITPVLSPYMLAYKKGINKLLPANEEDMHEMFSSFVYHKKRIPSNHQVLKGLLQLQRSKSEYLEQLFNSIAGATKEELEKHLVNIKAPTQVIWGANDELIDVSGATMLGQLVPSCRRVDILPECGHSVDMDQPSNVADLLMDFRR